RGRVGLPRNVGRALPDDVQVPPVVLAVRDRRGAPEGPPARQRARGLAAPALQPVEPGRLRPGPMILFKIPIISQLETVARHVLDWFHGTLHLPWAWAIVATTIVVRMLLVPLTVKQIHSMQNLQRFAPQMKEIQKKYKGDKAKQNEELMKFYRENNINPAASCLPMLFQLPVFIALYYALKNFSKHPPGGNLAFLHFIPSIAAHTTPQEPKQDEPAPAPEPTGDGQKPAAQVRKVRRKKKRAGGRR